MLQPGQRFARVPNKAVVKPAWLARCSIRKLVVVLPFVPVIPINASWLLGSPQKAEAIRPATWATGSATTKTGSPGAGGSCSAAPGPITAAVAPPCNAARQKVPPSTFSPGKPTNKVPAATRLESQVTSVIKGSGNPLGTLSPESRNS